LKRKIYIPYTLLLMVVLLIPTVIRSPYYLGVLIQAGLYSLIAMGLSLLMGYAGQISLGHAAFFGIGAYTSAILTGTYGWSPWPAILAGLLIAGMIAWIIGMPSLKLKGHYLAMATLGFGEIVYIYFGAELDLTGGPSGYIGAIPFLKLGGFALDNELKYYYFTWIIVLVILLLTLHIIYSRVGRALRSIHANEEAARAMGINSSRYKVQIFILSAMYASLAGSLYCHYILFVAPGPFDLMHSVLLVTMVIIGGIGSIWGAISGATLLTVLPEVLRVFKDYNILIYGGILLFIMLFMPGGFFGGSQILWEKFWKVVRRKKEVKNDGSSA
jgi:branched-chain amino acid transport system permease protein